MRFPAALFPARAALASLVAAVLISGCGGPPPPPGDLGGPPMLRAPSVYGLIGERSRLELTSEQIEALDSIGAWLAAQMEDTRYEVGNRTAAVDSIGARASREQVRSLNAQVNAGVQGILTAQQRATACDLERQRDERDGLANVDPRIRPGRGSRPNVRQAWSWCESEAPDDPRAD